MFHYALADCTLDNKYRTKLYINGGRMCIVFTFYYLFIVSLLLFYMMLWYKCNTRAAYRNLLLLHCLLIAFYIFLQVIQKLQHHRMNYFGCFVVRAMSNTGPSLDTLHWLVLL